MIVVVVKAGTLLSNSLDN